MSRIIHVVRLILIATVFSCSKEEIIPHVPPIILTPRIPSPLSGQEFVFDSLTWQGSDPEEQIYIKTPARSDLFPVDPLINNPYLDKEVSVKLDTAYKWLVVKAALPNQIQLPGQYYYVIRAPELIVYINPVNSLVDSRKAALKVKFL